VRRLGSLLVGVALGAVVGASMVRRLDEAQQRFAPDRLARAAREGVAMLRQRVVVPAADRRPRPPLATEAAAGVWHGRRAGDPAAAAADPSAAVPADLSAAASADPTA
jgi:hypothetical protein